jgi:glycosyltransferase involved in cell wall biosynthesis
MLGNKVILRVLNGVCNWVYRTADKLVVLSPGFKDQLVGCGVPQEKIEVIYNWCDETSLLANLSPDDAVRPLAFSGKYVVLFAGAMGLAQGLDTLLKCAAICKAKLPDVQFVLIGSGADRQRLEHLAVEMKLDNVTFLPRRTTKTMGEIYTMASFKNPSISLHGKADYHGSSWGCGGTGRTGRRRNSVRAGQSARYVECGKSAARYRGYRT